MYWQPYLWSRAVGKDTVGIRIDAFSSIAYAMPVWHLWHGLTITSVLEEAITKTLDHSGKTVFDSYDPFTEGARQTVLASRHPPA
jgi:hypothetical protein